MRIACPKCDAEYEVPPSRLPPRRMVRCARCGNKWMAPQNVVESLPPPADPPSPTASVAALPALTAMDRLAAQAAPPARPRGLVAAWVLSVLVLIAGLAGTLTWRQSIVHVWPASARILGPAEPTRLGKAAVADNETGPSPKVPTARR